MRKIVNIIFASLLLLGAASCQKEESTETSSEQLVVNYRNMRGTWELATLGGAAIEGDAYFYITFLLDDDSRQSFEAYTSFDSAFSSKSEGEYFVEADTTDSSLMIISGIYDNEFEQPWSSDYIVTSLTAESMEWQDYTTGELRSYARVDQVPADIVAGTRSL